MSPASTPHSFWHWPGWRGILFAYLVLGIPSFVWFVFVYAGTDYVTHLHSNRVPLYFPWETKLPFVPCFVLFYNSVHLCYALAPFVLRQRGEWLALTATWFLITLVAGVVFLIIPFELGYVDHDESELGLWRGLFDFADRANLRFNCCPSLHVTWGIATLDVYARGQSRRVRMVLTAWALGMTLSTVLLHQHHLIDVAGGILLGVWGSRFVFPRLARRWSAASESV